MKIAFVIPSLRQGGAQKIFTNLVEKWNDKDDCYLLVVEKTSPEQRKKYNISDSNIICLNKNRVILSVYEIYKKLKSLKFDAVFSTQTHLNIVVLLVSYFYEAKYIIRDSSVYEVMSQFENQEFITRILMKLLYNRADKIVCQSSDIRKGLEKIISVDSEKFVKINNPINVRPIPRVKRKTDSDVLNMVYVARFKSVIGLLRFLKILNMVNRSFLIMFIGDGPMMTKCVNMVKRKNLQDKVSFLGWVNPPYPQMRDCQLYVQTSLVEGFPNALLEAFSMGLPAIAYNAPGGTKELVNDFNGILIENGNSKQFAEAINNFEFEKYDSRHIRNDIKERFCFEKILKQYKGIVQ